MHKKNPVIFGLLAILLIGGSVLPAMSQTESEQVSQLGLNLDQSSYYLNQDISISGQIQDFSPSTTNPMNDSVDIIFIDSDGKTVSAGTYASNSGQYFNAAQEMLKFTVLPDSDGNFELTTVLNPIAFSLGSYSVQASTYQSGKIVDTDDFEIVSVPVEEVAEEIPIVFEFCHSNGSSIDASKIIVNYKKGLDVVDCVGDNNFLAGDKLFVRGTVILPDYQREVYQKGETFVTVSIPISQSITWSGNYVTTDLSTGASDDAGVEREQIKFADISFKALPEDDGSFVAIFDLPPIQFESGLYPIKVSFQGNEVEQIARIINESTLLPGEPELIVATDKNEYTQGEIVQISGMIQNSYHGEDVTVVVTTPDFFEYNCAVIECIVDNNRNIVTPEQGIIEHNFSWDYQLGSSDASLGKYTVTVTTPRFSAIETTFFVTEESKILEAEPVKENTSIPKKVIEKFNRISESTILISLEEKTIQDSELLPRVIQGSLFTAARGQEAVVNIQVSTPTGECVIGQDTSCMVNQSTRKPGAIYEVVTIGEENYKVRYSGSDVRLEKFSILPESSEIGIEIKDWNVQVLKDEQPTRFYYKISYVNLE